MFSFIITYDHLCFNQRSSNSAPGQTGTDILKTRYNGQNRFLCDKSLLSIRLTYVVLNNIRFVIESIYFLTSTSIYFWIYNQKPTDKPIQDHLHLRKHKKTPNFIFVSSKCSIKFRHISLHLLLITSASVIS